jgi:phosphoglucomutase
MGGAGVHYWQPIADKYKINLRILNEQVDPTFKFMTRDWDGQIRMDPSSPYAMRSLIGKAKDFDICFGCDTDHDRHGIVTKTSGLMAPNAYLATAIHYLFENRPGWPGILKIGKTLVSSQMIDRVSGILKRPVYEVPVGFKWFVEGLLQNQLGFAGEESAGATFVKRDGQVWTTDKDGIIPGLLAAEMTARTQKDPAALYEELTQKLGTPFYTRIEAPADSAERTKIKNLTAAQITVKDLAGDKIQRVLNRAPGNDAPIGGIKIETKNGWIAMRPSGTEDIYKIYGESFLNEAHLAQLLEGGQNIINKVLKT